MAKVNFNYHLKNIVTQSNDVDVNEVNRLRSDTVYQWYLTKVKQVEEELTTNEEITISINGEIVCENEIVKLENKNFQIIASDETKKLIYDIFKQDIL